jgi:tight adherence protein C
VSLMLPVLAFLFISLLVAAAAMMLAPRQAVIIERRLGELRTTPLPVTAGGGYGPAIARTLKRIGDVAPSSPSEMGKLQHRLVAAGYRGAEALPMFVGIRVSCAVAGFVLFSTPLLVRPHLLFGLAAAALGYLLPAMVLARLAAARQRRIQLSLPDALDLMVVSVEAGLGLDQALQRVGDELAATHRDLSDELRLVNLELHAGKARPEALRHLAERTGVDDLSSLVAVLVQTDKFGTSVAQSLRIHSETLRTKRRQRAEEAAAKTGVKMVFPLVFCIFPAIWVVTIGPAAIRFVQVLFPLAYK